GVSVRRGVHRDRGRRTPRRVPQAHRAALPRAHVGPRLGAERRGGRLDGPARLRRRHRPHLRIRPDRPRARPRLPGAREGLGLHVQPPLAHHRRGRLLPRAERARPARGRTGRRALRAVRRRGARARADRALRGGRRGPREHPRRRPRIRPGAPHDRPPRPQPGDRFAVPEPAGGAGSMSYTDAGRPAVLIFRKELLPWSETFIAAQGGALQRYRPVFAGYRLAQAGNSYLAGHERVVLADHTFSAGLGKAAIKALRLTPPRWRRALAAHHPVLLHAHFGTNALDAIPIARALGVPLVVTYHGMDIATRPRHARDRRRRHRVFHAAHRVIAVSGFIASRLREAGCPPDRIVIHHIGVDTRRFSPGDPAERVRTQILLVGRLVTKKGLTHLLRAMPRVQEAVPEAELVVVGDGPLRARHEAEAASLGVRCRFVG